MATLAILTRSDSSLTLLTTTDNAAALACSLGTMQPFEVEVFAEFPRKSDLLACVQARLESHHHANGWYSASAGEVGEAVCQSWDTATNEEEGTSGEEVEEGVATSRIDPQWHTLLEPCERKQAEKATNVRRFLKELLGRWQAECLLSSYKETCLRVDGICSRYIVNDKGETLRLAAHAAKNRVTEQ